MFRIAKQAGNVICNEKTNSLVFFVAMERALVSVGVTSLGLSSSQVGDQIPHIGRVQYGPNLMLILHFLEHFRTVTP